jgi:hypothetical protein
VPAGDQHIRYLEYPAERFSVADSGFAAVLVELTVFRGRSAEARHFPFGSIARRLAALGVSTDDLIVVLHEPPLENWGLHGRSAAEVDLGGVDWTSEASSSRRVQPPGTTKGRMPQHPPLRGVVTQSCPSVPRYRPMTFGSFSRSRPVPV